MNPIYLKTVDIARLSNSNIYSEKLTQNNGHCYVQVVTAVESKNAKFNKNIFQCTTLKLLV